MCSTVGYARTSAAGEGEPVLLWGTLSVILV